MDASDSRAQERVGTVLNDKWTLERLLGVGGMAAVYAARHRNGARAAVKVLHPDLSRHREVRERFLREGYAANKVEHPCAVKVLDDDVVSGGPDSGTAYLVMELLEGESLQDRLERGPPIGEREFLEIADTVLGVLDVAHAAGVVHRDLKPENLFLQSPDPDDPSGKSRIKVLDFGLARLLDGQTITSYGLALGTPSFMSPEQAAGRIDEIDGRTDLFALAATGFRLRTGRRIHEGANAVELVGKMANFAAPKIETYAPEVSAPFARVVDRALEFRRDDRYANAAAMREDVRRAIGEMEGFARTEAALPSPRSAPPPPRAPRSARPPPLASSEPTQEISARDLEPLPVIPAQPRRRKRRSILPWVTLAIFAAIGLKLWLDSRSAPGPGGPDAADSASGADSSAPSASGPPASTAPHHAPRVFPPATHRPSGTIVPPQPPPRAH
jgi:serine/threonine-protein kinase